MNYIDQLKLRESEKQFIRGLAAPSPQVLYGMIRANRREFNKHLGNNRTQVLTRQLAGMLTPTERQTLSRPYRPNFKTGARTPQGRIALPTAKYNIQRRDQLFRELESLRAKPQLTSEEIGRMRALESKLESMLNYAAT